MKFTFVPKDPKDARAAELATKFCNGFFSQKPVDIFLMFRAFKVFAQHDRAMREAGLL